MSVLVQIHILLFLAVFISNNVPNGSLHEILKNYSLSIIGAGAIVNANHIKQVRYSLQVSLCEIYKAYTFWLARDIACIFFNIKQTNSFTRNKKREISLEGSLDRVLFAAELEFLKIQEPRLPQHTSNVNNECAGKSEWSKQQYSL